MKHIKHRYYLVIDFGSQSIRAQVYRYCGQCMASASIDSLTTQGAGANEDADTGKYEGDEEVSPQPDWFYQRLLSVVQKLHAELATIPESVSLSDVSLMTLSCMRNTFIALDKSGEAVGNVIVWQDSNDATDIPKMTGVYRAAFAFVNLFYPILNNIKQLQRQAAVNKFYQRQQQAYAKISRICLLGGYLHYRLTGQLIDSHASTIAHLPLNFRSGRWQPRWHWYYQALALKPEWLPALCQSGKLIGKLNVDAQQLGLSKNCQVVAGASDKVMEMLGTGCHKTGDVHISLGSAICINALTDRFIGAKPLYPAFPFVSKDLYCSEVMLETGMLAVTAFIRRYCTDIMQALKGKENNKKTGKELTNAELLAQLDTLLLTLPDITLFHCDLSNYVTSKDLAGSFKRIPDDDMSTGLPLAKQAYHQQSYDVLYRYKALLDALVCDIDAALQRLKRRLHLANVSVHVSGGGANSDYFIERLQRTIGASIKQRYRDQATCRGGAAFLAYQDGQFASLEQALSAFLAKAKPALG